MIYTLNNDVLSMVNDIFSLNEANVYSLIQLEFNRCKALLKKKGVNYDSLQKCINSNERFELQGKLIYYQATRPSLEKVEEVVDVA